MSITSIMNRYLYRRGWQRNTYDDIMAEPVGRMLSCQLAIAVVSGATRITYGLPPGVDLSDQEEPGLETDEQNQVTKRRLNEPEALSSQAQIKSVRVHRRDQLSQIPLWHHVEGSWQYRPLNGPFVAIFPYFQQHVVERVVSINTDFQNERCAKWIEYTLSTDNGERDFVEVDLVYEDNGSFTIDLLGTRIEPTEVEVSRYPSDDN